MKNLIKKLFGVNGQKVTMCHLLALPGDPGYDRAGGLKKVLDHVWIDQLALTDQSRDCDDYSDSAGDR